MLTVLTVMAPTSISGGSAHASWLVFVIAPIAIVAGVLFAAKPELQWKANRWAYKNPSAMEPSAKGLLATRITGGFIAVVGVILLIAAITT